MVSNDVTRAVAALVRERLTLHAEAAVAALPVWAELAGEHEPVDGVVVEVARCEELVPKNFTYKLELAVVVQVRASAHEAAEGEALLEAATAEVEALLRGVDAPAWRGRELDALGCAATVLDLFYEPRPLAVEGELVRYGFGVRLYVQF